METRFIRANRAAREILGISLEEVTRTIGTSLVVDTPQAGRTVYEALERIRTAQRAHFLHSLDDLIATDDPALALAPSEDHSNLGAAISPLDPEYREPLVLQALMGYSTEKIASHVGLTKNAVLSRLHRTQRKLRMALAPQRSRREVQLWGPSKRRTAIDSRHKITVDRRLCGT